MTTGTDNSAYDVIISLHFSLEVPTLEEKENHV